MKRLPTVRDVSVGGRRRLCRGNMREHCDGTVLHLDCGDGYMKLRLWQNCIEKHTHMYNWWNLNKFWGFIFFFVLFFLFFILKKNHYFFPGKLYFWGRSKEMCERDGRKERDNKSQDPYFFFLLSLLLWSLLFWLRKGGWITWALKELFNLIKYSRGYFMAPWQFGLLLRNRCPWPKTQTIAEFGSLVKTANFEWVVFRNG